MSSVQQFLLDGEKAESFTIKEVAEHGCSGGLIPSLIYYRDTEKFHDEHEDWIWNQLYQHANDSGVSIVKYISQLNGEKDVGSMTQLKNLLAWWAAEVGAQYILNEREEEEREEKN
jgi:hypothetical protein